MTTNNPIIGISGSGQHHTNKNDDNPYIELTLNDIYTLVDEPQEVIKDEAQWLIPSTYHSRVFKEHEQNGQYHLLWCDFDKNPLPIEKVADIANNLDCDYEIYTSKSATQDNQKSRLLIPLCEPLSGGDWKLCQEVLNDYFLQHGATPDRNSEKSAQLCFLPNRGEYYASISERDSWRFDPMEEHFKTEIQAKREALEAAQEAKRKRIEENKAKREQRLAEGFKSPIDAFNAAYAIEDILLQAGYDQRGDSFRHPHSESGSYSANVKDERVTTRSTKDLLYCEEGAHDAFSAFEVLFHGGDRDAALKDAGDNWLKIGGESWNAVRQREYSEQQTLETFKEMFPQKGSDPRKPIVTLDSFTMNVDQIDDRLQQMADDVFILGGMAALQQITTFFAKPNTGKTLITLKLIMDDVKGGKIKGENVYYVNADDGGSGAMRKAKMLATVGVKAATIGEQGFKTGMLLDALDGMVKTGAAKGTVVIVDTYKKFANQMDKNQLAPFNSALREFTVAGGAVILLAHVNKRRDADGKLIAGGVSDAVDDPDAAYIIDLASDIPDMSEPLIQKSCRTVIFENLKKRGDNTKTTSYSYTDMQGQTYLELVNSVTQADEVLAQLEQTESIKLERVNKEKDRLRDKAADLYEFISDNGGEMLKTEIYSRHKDVGLTQRDPAKILDLFESEYWHIRKSEEGNKRVVKLIEK